VPPSEDRPPIRVAIVDDHSLFRDGIRQILQAVPDLEVIGEAGTAPAAVALVEATRPDVVLLDVELPGASVITTVDRINAVAGTTRVVILSMSDDPDVIRQLIDRKVHGYLLKSVNWHELVAVVRATATALERVTISVSRKSLHRFMTETAPSPAAGEGILSAREREVLQLTAQALGNAQIASRLELTEATVKRHLRNIFAKLGAVSRIDAVNRGVALRVISAAHQPSVER